jgi:hypothetical protein
MPPIEIVFTVEDRRKKTATTSIKLAEVESKARVNLFAVAWANVVDNIITGVIRSAVAILGVNISALTSNIATNDSDVEEIASAQFRSDAGTKVEINIPAVLETLVNNDTGDLEPSAPQVAAFLAMMEDGIAVTGGTIIPCDIGEEGNLVNVYFRERSRNSGTRKAGG